MSKGALRVDKAIQKGEFKPNLSHTMCMVGKREKRADCYFYFEHYDMGAHIPCCCFGDYGLGVCPCDDCTNYLPQREVAKIVREYLKNKESKDDK